VMIPILILDAFRRGDFDGCISNAAQRFQRSTDRVYEPASFPVRFRDGDILAAGGPAR
jgi:hypothetical protein